MVIIFHKKTNKKKHLRVNLGQVHQLRQQVGLILRHWMFFAVLHTAFHSSMQYEM